MTKSFSKNCLVWGRSPGSSLVISLSLSRNFFTLCHFPSTRNQQCCQRRRSRERWWHSTFPLPIYLPQEFAASTVKVVTFCIGVFWWWLGRDAVVKEALMVCVHWSSHRNMTLTWIFLFVSSICDNFIYLFRRRPTWHNYTRQLNVFLWKRFHLVAAKARL